METVATESTPRVVIADRRDASRQVADLMAQELARRAPVLGLATGSSMEPVYAEFADRVAAGAGLRARVAHAEVVPVPVELRWRSW